MDDDGYLHITDRKKELLVTAGGKNVAPQPIEQQLKQHPLVGEAVLLGDRCRFIAALVVPNVAEVVSRIAVAPDADPAGLVDRPDVRELFEGVVDRVNSDLPPYQQIRKFVLLPRELTVAAGELTPTLKVRRKIVDEIWSDVIEGLYTEQSSLAKN